MKHKLITSLIALYALSTAQAQISIDTTTPYTQNFDTLPFSTSAHVWASDPPAPDWEDNVTIPGWYGTGYNRDNDGTYTMFISDGSTGGLSGSPTVTSFGLANNTERSLGMIRQNSGTGFFGVRFVNDSADTLTELAITFTAQQWRQGSAAGSMNFSYNVGESLTLTSSGYTTVPLLGFTALHTGSNAALNGNLEANSSVLSHTITGLDINPGQEFWLRWSDSGTFQSQLAIDDLTVSAIPEPGTLVLLGIALGTLALFRRRR